MRICEVEGCNQRHSAKGFCNMHYLRLYTKGSLELPPKRILPVIDRIMAKIIVQPNGCWVFIGAITTNGYGHIRDASGKMRRPHVIMWEARNGSVPKGKELDHICRCRPCCNPDHLKPATHSENMLRRIDRDNCGFARLNKEDRQRQAAAAGVLGARKRWESWRREKGLGIEGR